MNQQPDKLFRDKLEGFQKTPPASAWDKISAAQGKKKSKGLWLRIAASLLLLAGATYFFWPKHTSPDTILSEATESKNGIVPPASEPAVSDPLSQTAEETKPEQIAQQEKKEERHELRKPNSKRVTAPVEDVETNEVATVNDDVQPDAIPEITRVDKNETAIAVATEEKSITLNYNAQEVSAYLNKNDLAEATSGENKPSTLKKLLKKANDLKTNQDPFGDLRQKKNEILALNFRNDKQRGQNK